MTTQMDKWRESWLNDAYTIEYIVFDQNQDCDTITMSTLTLSSIEEQHEPFQQHAINDQQAKFIVSLILSCLFFLALFACAYHL